MTDREAKDIVIGTIDGKIKCRQIEERVYEGENGNEQRRKDAAKERETLEILREELTAKGIH